MKLINAALREKNFKLKDLTPEIQAEIESFKKVLFEYNVLCDEWEEDKENQELNGKLEVMATEIEATDKRISEKIMAHNTQIEPKPQTVNADGDKKPKENKKSSTGWFVFAGAVLIVTLGAVNVFKKK